MKPLQTQKAAFWGWISGKRAPGLRSRTVHGCWLTASGISAAAVIAARAKEEGAVAIVLGLPVNMNGSEGPRAARVRQLAALIEAAAPELPVALMDERMTTMAATRFLNETDTRGKKRKGVIDTLSAQIILQNALDRLAHLQNSQNR